MAKKTTEFVLLFHKKTTEIVFLWSNIGQKCFKVLRKSKVGCHIGDVCINSINYADDIDLIYTSLPDIKQLINICEKYSLGFYTYFNPIKFALLYLKKK